MQTDDMYVSGDDMVDWRVPPTRASRCHSTVFVHSPVSRVLLFLVLLRVDEEDNKGSEIREIYHVHDLVLFVASTFSVLLSDMTLFGDNSLTIPQYPNFKTFYTHTRMCTRLISGRSHR